MAAGLEPSTRASPNPPDYHVDVAALLVAILVATLALAGQPGAWTWLASLLGVALLGTVCAFYKLPDPAVGGIQKWGNLIALSAVTALSSLLLVAWPAQEYWISQDRAAAAACNTSMNAARALALGPVESEDRNAAGPAADDIAKDAWGKCVGDMTTERLAWPTGIVFLGLLAIAGVRTSKRARLETEGAAVKVRTARPPMVAVRGANDAVTPLGRPLALRVTGVL